MRTRGRNRRCGHFRPGERHDLYCTDIWAYWESKLNQESAEIDALILKIQQEEGSNPAQTQADYITLQKLINQYNSDEEEMSNQVAKCQQQKPGIIGNMR